MKFICAGDLHIRLQAPVNRIDSFFDTQYKKIKWILEQAQKHKAVLLLPGDVFDSPKASHYLTSIYIELFKNFDVNITACMGQHDLRYHVSTDNTPFAVLNKAGVLGYVKELPCIYPGDNIYIYGADWNKPIPKPADSKAFNILLIHKMIIPNEKNKIWAGQTDYSLADSFLTKGYNLVVSGDNHQGFILGNKNNLLINCGSLMRSSSAQINHNPFIVLFDTQTRKYEKIFVPIKSAKEVFDLKKIEQEKEKDENITAFVNGLTEHKETGLNFESNLFAYCKENKVDEDITNIIQEALNGTNTQGID